MDLTLVIDNMTEKDWDQVKEIYQEGIDTGNATFEMETPSWEIWDSGHLPDCRFVARYEEEMIGWAALTPVSNRCVYTGVAEVSVYVSQKSQGRGIGTKLLDFLINRSEKYGIWTLQAGIFPENRSSMALHKKAGFRKWDEEKE
ncbi:GNAT family N-acetyltransferase [Pseudalkalibacillus sp. A8]|uniref:GNAT family N-acetyltransferase n=1 Tax=Pseudalkalibacillus sp. A8 TaxID=3382641 RepID=UPI0038B4EB66